MLIQIEPKKHHEFDDAKIKELLNQWSQTKKMVSTNFADSITIIKKTNKDAFQSKLITQYELRKQDVNSEPYYNQTIDELTTYPNIWDMWVPVPKNFETTDYTLKLPHTDLIVDCGICHTKGVVRCSICSGTGKKRCPTCNGTGRVGYGDEKTTCHECFGERQINCTKCFGKGERVCGGCEGAKRKLLWSEAKINFINGTQSIIYDEVTEIDKRWETGSVLVDNMAPSKDYVDNVDAPAPEVFLDDMIQKISDLPIIDQKITHQIKDIFNLENDNYESLDGCKRLFQSLKVLFIPIAEIEYTYKDKNYHIWICGKNNYIYAKNSPNAAMDAIGDVGSKLKGFFKKKK